MSEAEKKDMYCCSFVSIHYIICECGETFPTENSLKSHLEKEHPLKRERKEYKCGVCGSIYNTEEECVQHYEDTHIRADIDIKQEHDYFQDPDAAGELPPEEEQQDLTIDHDIVDTQTLEQQLVSITENAPAETVQIWADGADGEEVQIQDGQLVFFVSNQQNRVVVQRNSPKKPQTQTQTPRRKNYKHIVCEVCGNKYASNAALKYHQRVHTGERPYHCHLCPKAFTMPLFLQIHIRTHTGERPYKCSECPKAFSNKAAILRHNRVHTGERPYECPMCGKAFTQSNSMKLHVATVHLKQPAPYKSKSRRLRAQERLMAKGVTAKADIQRTEVKEEMISEEVMYVDHNNLEVVYENLD